MPFSPGIWRGHSRSLQSKYIAQRDPKSQAMKGFASIQPVKPPGGKVCFRRIRVSAARARRGRPTVLLRTLSAADGAGSPCPIPDIARFDREDRDEWKLDSTGCASAFV